MDEMGNHCNGTGRRILASCMPVPGFHHLNAGTLGSSAETGRYGSKIGRLQVGPMDAVQGYDAWCWSCRVGVEARNEAR